MLISLLRKINRVFSRLVIIGTGKTRPSDNQLIEDFFKRCREMKEPRVLELGTKRMIPQVKTKHDDWIPNASEFIGFDIQEGIDADVVGDVHRLSEIVGENQFDVIISCSSFEHFKYPQLAAHEIMKTLKIGGILFIQTHQSFPIHGVPNDYFRFSREALEGLFGTKMGFRVIATDYEFPTRMFSPEDLTFLMKSYVNVRLFGEKIAETPAEYIYELEN